MDAAISRLRAAHDKGILVGLKEIADAQGGPQKRLDIDELMTNFPDTFNLFLLAFQAIKSKDAADKHSFYQIAGIHGLPAGAWNGISPPAATADQLVGYCTHGDALFPSWHRVYVALLEQTLFMEMVDIAEKFPEGSKQRYRNAARVFRMPFWDYFRPRGRDSAFPTVRDQNVDKSKPNFDFDFSVPACITVEKIMIKTPDKDQPVLMDNPLIGSKLPQDPHPAAIKTDDWVNVLGVEGPHYSKESTHRHPTKQYPEGDIQRLNAVMNMRREDMMRYVLNIVLSDIYKSITSFATDASWDDMTSGSLEAYHNDYHVLCGGIGGHMANVPIAAFDPIFWLHHTNVDRYFAIWQAVHPDKWFQDPLNAGEIDKETKSLIPFQTNRGGSVEGYWTAAGSRDTRNLGHIYADANFPNNPQAAKDNLKKMYEWSRRLAGQNYGRNPFQIFEVSRAPFFQYGTNPGADYYLKRLPNMNGREPTYPPRTDKAIFSREWYIDNEVSRLALNGAFTIFWFVEKDITKITKCPPQDYVLLPGVAGMSHVFAAPVETCDNCAEQNSEAFKIRNTKPITAILLDYVDIGDLGSLDPEHVVPFLEKYLNWRIVTIGGDLIDPETVENFSVTVSVKATPLPIDKDLEPCYLSFPQITDTIMKREAIKAFEDKNKAEVAKMYAEMNKSTNIGQRKTTKLKQETTMTTAAAAAGNKAGAGVITTGGITQATSIPVGGANNASATAGSSGVVNDRMSQIIQSNLSALLPNLVDEAVNQYRRETGQ